MHSTTRIPSVAALIAAALVVLSGCGKETPAPAPATPPPVSSVTAKIEPVATPTQEAAKVAQNKVSAPAQDPAKAAQGKVSAPAQEAAKPAQDKASAPAQDASKLAQEKACLACHTIDKKVLGPAYKDVAAKYKGNENAEATLVKKVLAGGVGVWGQIPMPPNATVSEAEAQTLVKWILSLK